MNLDHVELPEIDDQDWMSSDGVARIKRDLRQKLLEAGYRDDSIEWIFLQSRMWEKACERRPTMRERVARAGVIRTSGTSWKLDLSEEQRQYLRDRLEGVNDPVGQSILALLQNRTSEDECDQSPLANGP